MRPFPLAVAAALIATAAAAQSTTTGTTGTGTTGTGTTSTGATPGAAPGMNPTTSIVAPGAHVMPTPGPVNGTTGTTAATGNDNQAVATTNANAEHPAHGANSFSRGQARTRITGHGFQNVSALRKDSNGVWRGKAMKDGQPVAVWLDYKGNVGQQ